jgi:23S rRNA (adenine2030-N6)-methyltransferase
LLPPPSRRALVLIDPPYEVKLDYKHVRDALDDALGRFPSGIYAVWYPVLQRMESRQFADRLKRLPAKEWLHVTLTVATPGPDGTGLHSSGMFILNPPTRWKRCCAKPCPTWCRCWAGCRRHLPHRNAAPR